MSRKVFWLELIAVVFLVFQTGVFILQTCVFLRQSSMLEKQNKTIQKQVSWAEFEQLSSIRGFIIEGHDVAPRRDRSDRIDSSLLRPGGFYWPPPNISLVSSIQNLYAKEKDSVEPQLNALLGDRNHLVSSTVAMAVFRLGKTVRHAKLAQTDFSGLKLENARFFKPDFRGANMVSAELKNLRLVRAQFIDVKIEKANLYGLRITGSEIKNVTFLRHDLGKANFSYSSMNYVFFDDVLAPYSVFDKLNNFNESKIDYRENRVLRFDNVNLYKSRFVDADLEAAVFANSILKEVDFQKANLSGVVFMANNLSGANFKDSILMQTTFKGYTSTEQKGQRPLRVRLANMSGVRMGDNILSQVKFRCVNLEKADLSKSKFIQCQFEQVNFSGVDLRGAEFVGANEFDEECDFNRVIVDGSTQIDIQLLKNVSVFFHDEDSDVPRLVAGNDLMQNRAGRLRFAP